MRQSEIVDAVRNGEAEFEWVPLDAFPGIEVMRDALKIGGVRVAVSAVTAQRVADILSGRDGEWRVSLTTPSLEDAIYAEATKRPSPVLLWREGRDISEWRWVEEHSRKLDEQLGDASGALVAPVGKAWCLVNQLENSPRSGCNYGYHGSGRHKAVTNSALCIVQPIYLGHRSSHYDYSQTLRLCRLRPDAVLPTHNRLPLRVLRQPGVALEAGAPPPPEAVPPARIQEGPLRLRALEVCLVEAERHGCDRDRETSRSKVVPLDRVADYFRGGVRDGSDAVGRWLADVARRGKRESFCAAAQGFCEHDAAHGETPPPWRVSVSDILADGRSGRGTWHDVAEAREGDYRPPPGALAIYWRQNPGSGLGHVERVVSGDEDGFRSVGANEQGGRWVIEYTEYVHPRLLGFLVDDENWEGATASCPEAIGPEIAVEPLLEDVDKNDWTEPPGPSVELLSSGPPAPAAGMDRARMYRLAWLHLAEAYTQQFGEYHHAAVQCAMGVAHLETIFGTGWKGAGVGSNNWGAIQDPRCSEGESFSYQDSHPNDDGTSTLYKTCFRAYGSALEGAMDLVRVMYQIHGRQQRVHSAALKGNVWQVSAGLHATRYYEGVGATVADRIRKHFDTLGRVMVKHARALHWRAPNGYPVPVKNPRAEGDAESIAIWQQFLGLPSSGVWDEATESATRAKQRELGVAVDGVPGEETLTWSLLRNDGPLDPEYVPPDKPDYEE